MEDRDRTDDYQRGDLRGIVFNIQDDMVGVRFMDGRVSSSMRLVTTAEGLLKIDPSGLPVARPVPSALPELETGLAEIVDVEIVKELPPGVEKGGMTLDDYAQMLYWMDLYARRAGWGLSWILDKATGRRAVQWMYGGEVVHVDLPKNTVRLEVE